MDELNPSLEEDQTESLAELEENDLPDQDDESPVHIEWAGYI